MKFGMFLPTIGPYATGPDALNVQRTVAQKAEELNFDSIWVPDHVVFPKTINSKYPYNETGQIVTAPILDPLAALGFLAGVTKTIKLGTFVLVLPHRNPIVTAKMWATLDVLSGGRMIFGAGIGWLAEEIELLGVPFRKRGAVSDEYLRAMKELWTNSDPQFEGEFVSFDDIKCEPKPLQQPLPIWIGGHSARAMRRVVEFGDGWLAVPKSVEAFEESLGALKIAADKAGRAMSDIPITISPMYVDSVDSYAEEYKHYSGMGYDSFFAMLPFWAQGLDGILKTMDDFAKKMNM